MARGRWARSPGQRIQAAGASLAASSGTLLTAAGSANTKGSYAELIASTPFDAHGVYVTLISPSGTVRDYLVDLAVGAANDEQHVVENMQFPSGSTYCEWGIYLPIKIPAGSRLSARCQSSTLSSTVRIIVHLFQAGSFAEPCSRVETCGAATADSGGTGIDPGGSANTKGAWVQMIASTAFHYRAVALMISNRLNATVSYSQNLIDIGVGASTDEMIVIPDLLVLAAQDADLFMPATFGALPVDIPAGSRVAIRNQCSITDATDRLWDAVLLGIGD